MDTKYQKQKLLKEFLHPKVFMLCILAGLMTFVCMKLGITYEMSVEASVFFVGIFFCFGIVMNTADERRFKAFDEIALIKANLLTYAQISRIWLKTPAEKKKIRIMLHDFLVSLSDFLQKDLEADSFKDIDKGLQNLALVAQKYREKDFPPAEISRLHQLLAQINFSFEKLLAIKEHRTPLMLRKFLRATLTLSVFILAPEFADLGYWGVLVAMLITYLLRILILIQEKIEHPFADDLDDVSFNFVERFEQRLK